MTPKLVKARPKAVEHLPDWAKCCSERIASVQKEGEITLDLSETRGEDGLTCMYCDSPIPNTPVGRDIADDSWVNLPEYDLDETGVPNGNYVEGPTA